MGELRVLPAGTQLGRFVVESLLGSGGMGAVYRARDPYLDRAIALKVLRSPDNVGELRLVREAQALAKLGHPNVVSVHDVGTADGQVFIAMELVEGQTLAAHLAERKRGWREILELYLQAGRGLAAAHARSIVHRDFKPANVLVDGEGRVRVTDFGLAQMGEPAAGAQDRVEVPLALGSAETVPGDSSQVDWSPDLALRIGPLVGHLTQAGAVIGTPRYMAPEQRERHPATSRSDQYAFCLSLWEALHGAAPPARGAGVPARLTRALEAGLSSDPAARHGSMTELLRILDASARRRGRLGLVVALAAIAVAAVVAFELAPRPRRPLVATETHRQLTFSGDAGFGELSPDGRTLAYVTGEKPRETLVVQDLASGRAENISWWHAIWVVRWSPDGSRLLVEGTSDDGWGIFVLSKAGGARRRFVGSCRPRAWSPDGTAYLAACTSKQLSIVDLATGEERDLPVELPSAFIDSADWSPATGRIALLTVEKQGYALWTMAPDGTELTKVFDDHDSSRVGDVRWMAGGDTLVYMRWRHGTAELAAVKVTSRGGEETGVLLRDIGDGFSLSADGTRLSYGRGVGRRSLVRLERGPDGKRRAHPLFTGTQQQGDIACSPDGAQIAFTLGAEGAYHIYVVPAGGGAAREVTTPPLMFPGIAWSPDSRSIVYTTQRDSGGELWRVEVATGAGTLLATDVSDGPSVAWAPARSIIYSAHGNQNLWVLDPETATKRTLVPEDPGGWLAYPISSPDGRRVAVLWNRGIRGVPEAIWAFSLDDGSSTQRNKDDVAPLAWPRDDALYAMKGPRGPWTDSLVVLPSDGAKAAPLLDDPALRLHVTETGHGMSLCVVPGTDDLVISEDASQADVWLTGTFAPEAVATSSLPPVDPNVPAGFPAVPHPTPVNLGFEDDGEGIPAGWHMSEGTSWQASARSSDEQPREGRRCLRLDGGKRGSADVRQDVDARPWRGQRVRLRAAVRAERAAGATARLLMQVERDTGEVDTADPAPITAAAWSQTEVDLDVAADADFLTIGMALDGAGVAWLDDVRLDRAP
jgi:Tol biopolymer transport system component/tRNA A-37 threonylcarbamoyl transferase component Bud32